MVEVIFFTKLKWDGRIKPVTGKHRLFHYNGTCEGLEYIWQHANGQFLNLMYWV